MFYMFCESTNKGQEYLFYEDRQRVETVQTGEEVPQGRSYEYMLISKGRVQRQGQILFNSAWSQEKKK